jgi:hypothetical protein
MLSMTSSRVLLVERPRTSSSLDGPKIRHYRLARMRLAERRKEPGDARFAHLRKTYD